MSRTKTFAEYIDFLETALAEDPLLIHHNVRWRTPDSRPDEVRHRMPASNLLYFVGGGEDAYRDLLNDLGFAVRVTVQGEGKSHSRTPLDPLVQAAWGLERKGLCGSTSFMFGPNARPHQFLYDPSRDIHVEYNIAAETVPDGELDVYTMAILARGAYLNTAQVEKLLRDLPKNTLMDFIGEGPTTLGEYIEDYGSDHLFKGRASAELNLVILKEMVRRKIPASLSHANMVDLWAFNEVDVKH